MKGKKKGRSTTKTRAHSRLISVVLILTFLLTIIPPATLTVFANRPENLIRYTGSDFDILFSDETITDIKNETFDEYPSSFIQINDIIGADFTGIEMPIANLSNNGFIAPIEPIPSNVPQADIVHINNANIRTINWAQSGKYYVLTENIHLTTEWIPINNFTGSTFDGQGHSINNMYVLSTNRRQYAGFFGQIATNNVTIKNVVINIGVNGITSSSTNSSYAGGLIGRINVSGNATITNCYTTGSVSSYSSSSVNSNSYVGGLIGCINVSGNINITDCYTTGNVSTEAYFTSSSIWSSFLPFFAGGLVGLIDGAGNTTITNCYATGNVSSSFSSSTSSYSSACQAGGLIGSISESNSVVTNCYATGNVSSSSSSPYSSASNAGGLIGRISAYVDIFFSGTYTATVSVSVSNCYATGRVSASSSSPDSKSYVGGLIGIVAVYDTATVTATVSVSLSNCYATGNGNASASSSSTSFTSSSFSNAGGLIGRISTSVYVTTTATTSVSANVSISDSYAMGDVKASATSGSSYAGGLVGYNSIAERTTVTITNCYATGDVDVSAYVYSASAYAGGMVGYNDRNFLLTVINSYRHAGQRIWTLDFTNWAGEATNEIGTPLTDAQMKNKNSFVGWNFETVWDINSNVNWGYPYLRSESVYQSEAKFKLDSGIDSRTPTVSAPITLRENWFTDSSTVYNHDLAKTSMGLSASAYTESNEYISEALKGLGFNPNTIEYYNYKTFVSNSIAKQTATQRHKIAFTFAEKEIICNNKKYFLIAVVCRGTVGLEEWYSDFDISNSGADIGIHYGINIAAEELRTALEDYIWSVQFRNSTSNIKIWVTGHSRGAAVANLVAANLTKNLPDMKNNIFAYTFATPSVSKMTYSEKRSYNNIFNILNPEDFITYMPLRRWEYYKYGIDKILPTKSIISKKNPIFSKMEDTFRSLTNVKFKSFPKGAVTTQNFLSDIFKFVAKNINDYYTKNIGSGGFVRTFKDYLYNLADQLIYGNPLLDTAPLILTYNYNIVSKISLGYFKKHTDNITFAHAPETYVSWVNSGLASELYIVPIEKTSYEFIIKCPVDINVYDTNNIIVGRVINNIVDETIEDSIVIDVEDDIKYLYLPSDETYEIEIIATNTGTMEYTVCEVLPDGTEIRRYNTYNIPLEIGKKMISNINNSSEVTPDYKTISVVNYAGTIIETISPTEIIEEVDLYNVTITLNANEGGCVFGDIICTKGDYITIGAEANEGWQFEGWYENNVKISDNAIYSFTATENRTLEARFVKYKIDGITKFMTGVTPNNNNVGEIIEYFITKGENANNWEFLNNNNILLKATDKVGTGTKIWNDSELIATVIIYGDIDGDGEITSADATLILRYIAEVGEFLNKYQKEAANVFGDGEITSANATLILRYIVGLENNLAP